MKATKITYDSVAAWPWRCEDHTGITTFHLTVEDMVSARPYLTVQYSDHGAGRRSVAIFNRLLDGALICDINL